MLNSALIFTQFGFCCVYIVFCIDNTSSLLCSFGFFSPSFFFSFSLFSFLSFPFPTSFFNFFFFFFFFFKVLEQLIQEEILMSLPALPLLMKNFGFYLGLFFYFFFYFSSFPPYPFSFSLFSLYIYIYIYKSFSGFLFSLSFLGFELFLGSPTSLISPTPPLLLLWLPFILLQLFKFFTRFVIF